MGGGADGGANAVNLEREHLFALGVWLGLVLGVIVGSFVAPRLSDETAEYLRRLVERLAHHEPRVAFEALLQ